VHAFGACTPIRRHVVPCCRSTCSPGRRDALFRRGPWGHSPCLRCHHEERSDEGSAVGCVSTKSRFLALCGCTGVGSISPAVALPRTVRNTQISILLLRLTPWCLFEKIKRTLIRQVLVLGPFNKMLYKEVSSQFTCRVEYVFYFLSIEV
jgi:hypothetical protein